MRTKVFAHNGIVGIMSAFDAEGLINDPTQPGQLGFVINTEFVDVSQEAYDILKDVKKSHDAIGDVMCFESADKVKVFGFLGGPLALVVPGKSEADREYNPSLLESQITEVEVPEDFKKFVEETFKKE